MDGPGNSYVVLARKYRPLSFESLIGQDAMVQTLTNDFEAGRIHHAFILTGLRGAGKTTNARILSRATQGLIYLALIILPLSGAMAWFFGIKTGILVHGLTKNLLLALILVHIAGALAQQFWFRSNALMKMLGRA